MYELRVDSQKFVALEATDEATLDLFIDGFDGRSMAETWPAPHVRLMWDEKTNELLISDFPYLSGAIPVFSGRAKHAFADILVDRGEFLPLRCDDGEYWLFNVLTVLDVMDEQESIGDYLAPGRLMRLNRLVVRRPPPDEVSPIFKLPQWLRGSALITDTFIDRAIAHGLTGLSPRPIGEV